MAFEHLTKKELLEKMESLRLEVAEYEKAESEKLYEEKLYRSLAVTAEAGVYIVKDGIFRFVNQFTASRLGCKPAELIGMRAVDFIHPDDREMVRQKASDMLRGKRSAPYEFRTIGKDGKIHWILESVTSIEFGAGRAILGQSMDITKQVDARTRLAELEALEASILESIPHAVIGLKNRQIIFANDGVETGLRVEARGGHRQEHADLLPLEEGVGRRGGQPLSIPGDAENVQRGGCAQEKRRHPDHLPSHGIPDR